MVKTQQKHPPALSELAEIKTRFEDLEKHHVELKQKVNSLQQENSILREENIAIGNQFQLIK